MKAPPSWLLRFLEYIYPRQLAEGIIGDIWEAYDQDQESRPGTASLRLYYNSVRFLRPAILLRHQKSKGLIYTAMFKTNFLIASRNMLKNKFYTFINLFGLSLGITFLLLVFIYSQNALSHDSFHKDSDQLFRLYRTATNSESGELKWTGASMPIPLGEDIIDVLPGIATQTRYLTNESIVEHKSENLVETVAMADPSFFEVFSFPILEGNSQQPLENLNDVVLSPEYAKKYFGYENPISQTLKISLRDQVLNGKVTAVADPMDAISSIKFDILVHFDHIKALVPEEFVNGYNVGIVETYVKLLENQSVASLEEELTTFYQSKGDKDNNEIQKVHLQPIEEIYLDTDIPQTVAEVSSPIYIYILGGLGLLVLIIASINFIMLTSSQAFNRIKEFGVKKTMGAFKGQLFAQLIGESLFLAVLASLIAVVLAYQLLPLFANLAGTPLSFEVTWLLVLFLFGLVVLISALCGVLSSGFLVRVEAASALKGDTKIRKNSWVRNTLIITQFSFSICLIIGTLVFRSQMKYISEKSLGFDKEELLEVALMDNATMDQAEYGYERFKTLASSHPELDGVAAVMNDLRQPWTGFSFAQEDESMRVSYFNLVSPNYIETMGLELIMGRDFRENDRNGYIVNESFLEKFEMQDPIGKQVPGKDFESAHQIIGVVKDFHFGSLHEEITPLILGINAAPILEGVSGLSSYNWPPLFNQIVVRSSTDNFSAVTNTLKMVWNEAFPDQPFVLRFYDDILDEKYDQEKRYSKIIDYAAIFSTGIAWLGLLGLTRLTVQNRLKEVGIRKVLGSSPFNITLLISRRFLLLIVIANLIAWPLAWYGLNEWLSSFHYKIQLSLWSFFVAGLGTMIVVFSSVSLQSLKAALVNPIETLRME